MREHRRNLEAADQPETRDHGRLHPGDVAALEPDRAPRRRQEGGQQVEARRLAGPVRTDQGVDGARLDAQIDAVNGNEAAEFSRQALCLQDGVCHPRTSPSLDWFQCAGRFAYTVLPCKARAEGKMRLRYNRAVLPGTADVRDV